MPFTPDKQKLLFAIDPDDGSLEYLTANYKLLAYLLNKYYSNEPSLLTNYWQNDKTIESELAKYTFVDIDDLINLLLEEQLNSTAEGHLGHFDDIAEDRRFIKYLNLKSQNPLNIFAISHLLTDEEIATIKELIQTNGIIK